MQWLANVSVRRPVFATVLMLSIVVIGIIGYAQLGVNRFPKIDFPTIMVLTRLPGAAPEEVETEVTEKVEEAVNTLSGIDELRSITSEGQSLVMVTFVLEKDIDVGAQEVRDRVSSVLQRLPSDIDPPSVTKFAADASPIMTVSVNAERPIREITELADKLIRPQLENVSGVGELLILGGRKRQVNIWVDPLKLRAANVTALEVQRAVAGQNVSMPSGSLETGPEQLTLRLRGRVETPEQLGALVVRQVGEHPIRVRDVARVEDGEEAIETAAVHNGRNSVVLSIKKQSGSNTVAVVDGVRERMADIQKSLPQGYGLEVVRDNSQTIRTSVSAVIEHLLLGSVFAALVVLIFLGNLRSTLIAAFAIPVSIIGTFALMWSQGFTLDTITLLALALAVGIVIDDAIVVLENVWRFIDEKGMSPVAASILATREIGLAVLATTISLIAVFLPVAFMPGIVGRFLNSFGLTMSMAIGVSMLVSFTLTPMLSSRWLKSLRPVGGGEGGRHTKKSLLERIVDRVYLPIERVYVRALGWVMAHRWVVVVASGIALVSIVPLMGRVSKGFLPKSDEAQFEVNIRAPEGTSVEATELVGERIARRLREMSGVASTLVTVGSDTARTPNLANVYVRLVDPEARPLSQDAMMDKVRKEIIVDIPKEMRVDVSDPPMFEGGGTQAPIMYELTGPDLNKLEVYSERVVDALKKVQGAVDVKSSLITGKPEVGLRIDRERAAFLGVGITELAATLRLVVGGAEISTYEENGKQYEVRLRAERPFRGDVASLGLISVPAAGGRSVPLLDVVKVDHAEGPSSIQRLNRRRQVLITSNLAPGYAESDIIGGLDKIIQELNLEPGYGAGPTGRSREMARTGKSFLLAFGLAFVFMYLVLTAQLESWLHPLTILLSLPLTLPFALISLIALGQSLDIYSSLGMLVLFGVVKKNSILQIDHTNHLRAEGMPRLEAILQANRDRLRPILMTTFAFVAGMIPLATATGIGSGFNRATSGVIVGGQLLSLLLTLLATPVAYSLLDDASNWVKARTRRREFAPKEIDRLVREAEENMASG